MKTTEDLCVGYLVSEEYPHGAGSMGICRCGLHWHDVMPPHLSDGTPITHEVRERIRRREAEASEVDRRRAVERVERVEHDRTSFGEVMAAAMVPLVLMRRRRAREEAA